MDATWVWTRPEYGRDLGMDATRALSPKGELQCGVGSKAGERNRVIGPVSGAKAFNGEVRSNARRLPAAHKQALAAHSRFAEQRAVHIARSPEIDVGRPATRDV